MRKTRFCNAWLASWIPCAIFRPVRAGIGCCTPFTDSFPRGGSHSASLPFCSRLCETFDGVSRESDGIAFGQTPKTLEVGRSPRSLRIRAAVGRESRLADASRPRRDDRSSRAHVWQARGGANFQCVAPSASEPRCGGDYCWRGPGVRKRIFLARGPLVGTPSSIRTFPWAL